MTSAAKPTRRNTVPSGPNAPNSPFANAAPSCTDTIDSSTSATGGVARAPRRAAAMAEFPGRREVLDSGSWLMSLVISQLKAERAIRENEQRWSPSPRRCRRRPRGPRRLAGRALLIRKIVRTPRDRATITRFANIRRNRVSVSVTDWGKARFKPTRQIGYKCTLRKQSTERGWLRCKVPQG